MNEKYLATIMKKHLLGNGEAIYTIKETLIGTFNKENNTFIDQDGNVYRHICDKTETARNLTNQEYYNLTPIDQIKQTYPEYTDEDIIETFNQSTKSTIYLYSMLNEQNPMVMSINTEEVKQMFTRSLEQRQQQNYQSEEEEVASLIAKIATGCFTEEELEDIKNQSGNSISLLTRVIESVEEYRETNGMVEEPEDGININEIFGKVTETLIDQDEPARRLIVEIDRSLEDSDGTGILLTGNSGSGKTLLISLLGKHLNKPFMIIDSTQLTTPGHVGRSIEQYLWELYEMCNYDIDATEHAIICFDEIDKKGSEKKSDIAGQGVLNTLLKFLDGSTYIACKNPQVVTDGSSVPICTKNMTVIAGGAFSEIYETKEKNSIGFSSKQTLPIKKEPEINDFINKAMMSKEFMARFPVIIRLNNLTENSLRKILTESTASPLKRQQEKFERRGVTLEVTEDFLSAVAKRAIERQIGARGLHKIIKDTTWKPYDKVKSEVAVYDKVILDESTLDNVDSYQLIKRRTSD